ncbi:MAG: TolC family protein [Gammaproteobacteria bacterium]|nr:TolC family protein [Gammaproteobacteria bacterium]
MFSKKTPALLYLPFIFLTTLSQAQPWTLETSVQQALSTSPELKQATAELMARQVGIHLSTMWPDPSIEFRLDDKLGQDDNKGGFDLTDITISQPLPMSRLKHQKSAAVASMKASQFDREFQALLLQNRVSKVFHQLQLTSAKLALAKKRLQLADKFNSQRQKSTKAAIIRYLTPLEKMRLSIIREEASQAANNAEGKYHEALIEFVKLLAINTSNVSSISKLQSLDSLPALDKLLLLQKNHVMLSSQQQELLAAKHAIDVARNSQSEDPTISLSQSRESFTTGRGDVLGIMFNIQIPIHDRKSAAVSQASYQASQKQIELQRQKRELQINLKRSITHLHHVVEQASDYQLKVLNPAQKVLDLTNKGFASGELNVLSLVDANNTYFEARLRHLDLLYQARLELAEINLFAGKAITDFDVTTIKLVEGESK